MGTIALFSDLITKSPKALIREINVLLLYVESQK